MNKLQIIKLHYLEYLFSNTLPFNLNCLANTTNLESCVRGLLTELIGKEKEKE